MDTKIKACILCAHNDKGWYPRGQQRLERSLVYHGFKHDFLAVTCLPSKDGWHTIGQVNGTRVQDRFYHQYKNDCPYTLKAAAWHYAKDLGYDVILWLDCSVWAITSPAAEPILDIINHTGSYFWRSGFTLAETGGQHALDYMGWTRKKAQEIQDTSTSMMGLKLSNPKSHGFLSAWLEMAQKGIFHGARDPIPDAKRGEQMFQHRQDQTAATMLAYHMGMHLWEPGQYSSYANPRGEYADSVSLVMQGM